MVNSRGCICWHSYQKHSLLIKHRRASSGISSKGAKSQFIFDFIALTGESKELTFINMEVILNALGGKEVIYSLDMWCSLNSSVGECSL